MWKILLSSALLLSIATPASANWQYTKWGMSREELKAASPYEIKDSSSRCGSASPLASEYWAGRIEFTACYGFSDRNELHQIKLYLHDYSQSNIVEKILKLKYGKSTIDLVFKEMGIVKHEWQTEDKTVWLFDIQNMHPQEMYIDYRSLKDDRELAEQF